MTDGGYTFEEWAKMHGIIYRKSWLFYLGEEGERLEAEKEAEIEALLDAAHLART